MSAINQIKFNTLCCIKDANNLKWKNFLFHWAGLKRGLKDLRKYNLTGNKKGL